MGMRSSICGAALLGLTFCFGADAGFTQSLAEAARKEAERRKQPELQGVEEKVISNDNVRNARGGSLTVSSSTQRPQVRSPEPSRGKGGKSLQAYSNSIKKLDREIRQGEERLTELRSRLQAERWAIVKTGRSSSRTSGNAKQERTAAEIQVLETRLKRLREERQATYDAGRKAGFQPGELEGRGLVP